ncbi:zinc finger protein 862-like [Zeugodacus cucurbitae]|uniref:zinc finger protein 862 n=1 Tax=Zeugodacus cucurbitae TaxID=28588 RepID=UPI0023D95148|nr:zinc finger protein 862 [Zeugodacus cucurbitae]XP_054082179.1 zinc finger protein 862-like [Zeugodacus cucurbitae]XP_054087486.1 zinc finger protein 862-like isoform X1 [Zeugodacus cucurbitae]XP_054089636.1 zinc finger protein 862-like isoform X1 [Zeugodacus cucurbitae]XP_054089737.1 zinc finger protein 862-like [Zeugodacus cucurbitae]
MVCQPCDKVFTCKWWLDEVCFECLLAADTLMMDRFIVKKSRIDKQKENEENFTEEDITEEEDQGNNNEPKKSKRTRKFRTEWLKKFPWLENKNGLAFCKACNKNSLNILSHLNRHASCSSHVQNMETKKSQLSMETFLDTEKEQMSKKVQYAEFTLVMFLITHNLPFLLMDVLPALLAECCPDSEVAKRLQIARTKATNITKEIASKTTSELVSTLKNCKFSIIIDETTDISIKKCLVMVVRYVVNFIAKDRFLALIELPKCDSASVFGAVKKFLLDNNIPLKNIIGMATDGASVMAGHLSGVKALLESETNIFYLKCTCHSLHLCVSYATKKIPEDVNWLCRNIYSFFSHSPKRVHDFKEFQEYCSVKPHKILGVCQTRWLSLEGVVSRINEQWDALKFFFIYAKLEVNAIRSNQLAEKMEDNKTKSYFLFLSYALPLINNLNKEFQSEKSRLPYLYSSMKSYFLLILNNFIAKNKELHVNINYKSTCNHIELPKIFIGTKAEVLLKKKATADEINEVKGNILAFYIELLDQIKLRFDFSRKDLELLKLITPEEVMSANDNNILDLVLEYADLFECECDKIITQWTLFKLSNHNLNSNLDIDLFWEKVASMKDGLGDLKFPDLSGFVFNLLSLPHSSAVAERKFSSLKLIKTSTRNKLEVSTLHAIMTCKELTNRNIVWSAKKDFP